MFCPGIRAEQVMLANGASTIQRTVGIHCAGAARSYVDRTGSGLSKLGKTAHGDHSQNESAESFRQFETLHSKYLRRLK